MLHRKEDKMEQQLYYKYVKMELEQFAMFEENISNNKGDVEFQTQALFSYDKKQSVLCSKITATMTIDNKSLMRAVFCSYFAFHKDSIEQMCNEEGKLVFPPHVLVQFASLNYGSLRGVLFLKTQDTPLADYILPPAFFNQIIDKAFVAE